MVTLRTTPDERQRLAELRQAATPGPWTEREDERNPAHRLVFGETMDVVDVRPWPEVEENAALIVAARNALPDLLADLDTLEAEVARLAGELAYVRGESPLIGKFPVNRDASGEMIYDETAYHSLEEHSLRTIHDMHEQHKSEVARLTGMLTALEEQHQKTVEQTLGIHTLNKEILNLMVTYFTGNKLAVDNAKLTAERNALAQKLAEKDNILAEIVHEASRPGYEEIVFPEVLGVLAKYGLIGEK